MCVNWDPPLASSNFTSSTPELPQADKNSFLAGLWLTLSYDDLSIKPCTPTAPSWASAANCTGWDETNFLGRDRDREIGLLKFLYETETTLWQRDTINASKHHATLASLLDAPCPLLH